MMEESPEYLILLNMRNQMSTDFKKNLVELATSLHREGLIDYTCYEVVSRVRSFLTETEKVEEIIEQILNKVQLSTNNFHKLIDILQQSGYYGPLVDKMNEEYIKQQGGLIQQASGKRKKFNKHELAEWLEYQGIDDDDVELMKERGVNEALFLHLERGDDFLSGVSEVTLYLLETLKTELKQL